MKKIKYLCLVIFVIAFSISLFGCGKNINKYEWNEAYKVVYGEIHSSTSGGSPYQDYYCVISEENYQNIIGQYGSETRITWNAKIKTILVKFDENNCYIKLISWGGNEEEKTYSRGAISYVDYL